VKEEVLNSMPTNFTACNRFPQAVAIHNEITAYCASTLLSINNQLLVGHSANLTCVIFLTPDLVLTGSADKTLILWKMENNIFSKLNVLEGHEAVNFNLI
jgi:WD40 repeat protein